MRSTGNICFWLWWYRCTLIIQMTLSVRADKRSFMDRHPTSPPTPRIWESPSTATSTWLPKLIPSARHALIPWRCWGRFSNGSQSALGKLPHRPWPQARWTMGTPRMLGSTKKTQQTVAEHSELSGWNPSQPPTPHSHHNDAPLAPHSQIITIQTPHPQFQSTT